VAKGELNEHKKTNQGTTCLFCQKLKGKE